MNITQAAISLNVPDVEASADFARAHFGYEVAMAAEGFVSLHHAAVGTNLIFLATGLDTFKPREVAGSAGQGSPARLRGRRSGRGVRADPGHRRTRRDPARDRAVG